MRTVRLSASQRAAALPIAVNEALGYTILGEPGTWWRLEAAALLG